MKLLEKIIKILYIMIIHPIKMGDCLKHCWENNHQYYYLVYEFRCGVKCVQCDEIFIDD